MLWRYICINIQHSMFTARCKTIDHFLEKQDRIFLFTPWHVNKDFECRIGMGISRNDRCCWTQTLPLAIPVPHDACNNASCWWTSTATWFIPLSLTPEVHGRMWEAQDPHHFASKTFVYMCWAVHGIFYILHGYSNLTLYRGEEKAALWGVVVVGEQETLFIVDAWT